MTIVWITIAALAVGTALIKGAGPVATGGRTLSPLTQSVVRLIAPAILAGLIVYETFIPGHGEGITIDARIVGVAAAATCFLLRVPMLLVIFIAAGTTATARAIGWS